MNIAQITSSMDCTPPRLDCGTESTPCQLNEARGDHGHDVTSCASGNPLTNAEVMPRTLAYDRADGPRRLDPIGFDRVAVLLDIDGTVLDIAATPDGVCVPPTLRPVLSRLLTLTGQAVALVSGRTIHDIDRLFTPLQLPAIGGHGAEIRTRAGGPVDGHQAAPLDSGLRQRVAAIAAVDPRIIMEDKGYSIALHYRLAPEQRRFILEGMEAAQRGASASIEILRGKAVFEIKSTRFSKGTTVSALMAEPPFAGRLPIFVGDDVTDESVFAVMPKFGGRAYSVGHRVRGVDGRFSSPHDVRQWLARLSEGADCRLP